MGDGSVYEDIKEANTSLLSYPICLTWSWVLGIPGQCSGTLWPVWETTRVQASGTRWPLWEITRIEASGPQLA